jgi:dipeptide/tripeptide permease
MNLMASIGGITAPVLTGFIVWRAHAFSGAFLAAGLVIALGIFFFTIVMGAITNIAEPGRPADPIRTCE